LACVLESTSSTNPLHLLSNLHGLDSCFLVGLLWLPIRYNFVNLQLAALGAVLGAIEMGPLYPSAGSFYFGKAVTPQ